MKANSDQLLDFFNQPSLFTLIIKAENISTSINSNIDYCGYLNPIHPFHIHVIGENELSFLNSLKGEQINKLLQQLQSNQASFLLFNSAKDIPDHIINQNFLHIVINENSLSPENITRQICNYFAPSITKHGNFVVVYNQGFLITGNSGIGKSQLLMELIKNGHLWISDDMTEFTFNNDKTVIARENDYLPGYLHLKGVGPINVDQTYGKACRIKQHPLAGIIRLEENTNESNQAQDAYGQQKTTKILGQTFPLWQISAKTKSLCNIIETCARQLILKSWGNDAARDMEKELNRILAPNYTAKTE